ncbi:MAG: hypothetical protein QM698_07400 [Micropepsaceae bacterium]
MEFAVLAAGVDGVRQVGEESLVEEAARKGGIEAGGIDGRDMGDEAACDHLAGEQCGVAAPDGEDRGHARFRHAGEAVGADILKKEIAEDHVGDAVRFQAGGGFDHAGLIDGVGARGREHHLEAGKAQRRDLGVEQFVADAVHGDAVMGFADRSEQADDIEIAGLARGVESPGAVLAGTP